jgi:hypothetical protein
MANPNFSTQYHSEKQTGHLAAKNSQFYHFFKETSEFGSFPVMLLHEWLPL